MHLSAKAPCHIHCHYSTSNCELYVALQKHLMTGILDRIAKQKCTNAHDTEKGQKRTPIDPE